jgi:hypothetical protein
VLEADTRPLGRPFAVGITMAALGAEVCMTDQPRVLDLLRHNVRNCLPAQVGDRATVLVCCWAADDAHQCTKSGQDPCLRL